MPDDVVEHRKNNGLEQKRPELAVPLAPIVRCEYNYLHIPRLIYHVTLSWLLSALTCWRIPAGRPAELGKSTILHIWPASRLPLAKADVDRAARQIDIPVRTIPGVVVLIYSHILPVVSVVIDYEDEWFLGCSTLGSDRPAYLYCSLSTLLDEIAVS